MSVSMRVIASEWAGQRECVREINNCANQLHLESSLRLGCHGISKQRFRIFRDGRVFSYNKGTKLNLCVSEGSESARCWPLGEVNV